MKRKEQTKTFIMISNLTKIFAWFIYKYFSTSRVKWAIVALFEYLCHILNISLFQCGGRQNLTSEVGPPHLKGHAHAKIIKKSVILFRLLNMTI